MVWVVLQTSSYLLADDSKAFDKMKCSFFFFFLIPICYKMLTFLRKPREHSGPLCPLCCALMTATFGLQRYPSAHALSPGRSVNGIV